jgi:hypothetical protein
VLFLVLVPGVVAGLVPWLLTGWRATGVPVWLEALGWVVLVVGAVVLLEAFARIPQRLGISLEILLQHDLAAARNDNARDPSELGEAHDRQPKRACHPHVPIAGSREAMSRLRECSGMTPERVSGVSRFARPAR